MRFALVADGATLIEPQDEGQSAAVVLYEEWGVSRWVRPAVIDWSSGTLHPWC